MHFEARTPPQFTFGSNPNGFPNGFIDINILVLEKELNYSTGTVSPLELH